MFRTVYVNLMNLSNLLYFGSDQGKLILSSILKNDTESMGEREGRREQRERLTVEGLEDRGRL